jgi:hypothetical protein
MSHSVCVRERERELEREEGKEGGTYWTFASAMASEKE